MLFKKQRNLLNLNWGASLALFAAISLFSAPAAQAQSGPRGVINTVANAAGEVATGVKNAANAAGEVVEGLLTYWTKSEPAQIPSIVRRQAVVGAEGQPFFTVSRYGSPGTPMPLRPEVTYFGKLSNLTQSAKTQITASLQRRISAEGTTARSLIVEEGFDVVHVTIEIPIETKGRVISYFSSLTSGPEVSSLGVSKKGYVEVEFIFDNSHGPVQSQILKEWGIF